MYIKSDMISNTLQCAVYFTSFNIAIERNQINVKTLHFDGPLVE